MTKYLLALSVLISSISAFSKEVSKDPFKNFSLHKLGNGMTIVLAPNENSKNIKMKLVVGSGRWSETKENLHGNHVLEHMLFKDGRIDGEKSYLEIIKEAGGDVNAYVTNDHTAYHTTIAADKSEWLVEKFETMLFSRELEEKELTLGKASVVLEIGKPFLLNRPIGANPVGWFFSNYFSSPNYNEKEYGFPTFPFSSEDERLAVKELTIDDVKQIYADYYHPGNMTILLAGNFNQHKILSLLKSKFEKYSAREGKKLVKFKGQRRGESHHKSERNIFKDNATVSYGTKLFRRSIEDVLVVQAYNNYVAHRLMIELRNKKGETYTAYGSTHFSNDLSLIHI